MTADLEILTRVASNLHAASRRESEVSTNYAAFLEEEEKKNTHTQQSSTEAYSYLSNKHQGKVGGREGGWFLRDCYKISEPWKRRG